MAYINGKKVLTVVQSSGGGSSDYEQATTTLIKGPLTNLNGRVLSAYTATLTTIGGYECYQIKKNNAVLTEEEAADYMEYQTGSRYVPKYNYEKPLNSLFIFTTDQSVWKPQYDSTNGLLLYAMGVIGNEKEHIITLNTERYETFEEQQVLRKRNFIFRINKNNDNIIVTIFNGLMSASFTTIYEVVTAFNAIIQQAPTDAATIGLAKGMVCLLNGLSEYKTIARYEENDGYEAQTTFVLLQNRGTQLLAVDSFTISQQAEVHAFVLGMDKVNNITIQDK